MRYSPATTRRMIVTRSSGPTSLRMNAAAPALIASNSASSSSSDGQHDDRRGRQLALDPLGRLDAAGRGQREVHQDDVGRRLQRAIDGAAGIVGLGDDLEVGFAAQDVGDPHPEEGVVVDDEDPRPCLRGSGDPDRRVVVRARCSRYRSCALLCSRRAVSRDRQPDDGAAVRSRSYVETSADQLGSLAHELEAEVAAAAGGHRLAVEAATVVADLEGEPVDRPPRC